MDNNSEVINVAHDKWVLKASEGSFRQREKPLRRRLSVCVPLGQAGPLISAQGYVSDVGSVATMHHTGRMRNASLSGELQHSVSRERTLLLLRLHVGSWVSECTENNTEM